MWRDTTLLTDRAAQFATEKKPTSFQTQCYVWEVSSVLNQSKHGKARLNGLIGNTLSQRFGSDRRGTDGIRVEKFPRIHYSGNSRRDSKDDD